MKMMKKFWLPTTVILLFLTFGAYAFAQGPGMGMMGPGWGGYGGYGQTGPGWGGYGGYGMMGRGMMGGGGMMGPGWGGYGPQNCPYCTTTPYTPYSTTPYPTAELTKDRVTTILQDYLTVLRNPNLKLGDITEKETYFEADVVTKDNSLVDKLLVDKRTGWIGSAYRPY